MNSFSEKNFTLIRPNLRLKLSFIAWQQTQQQADLFLNHMIINII